MVDVAAISKKIKKIRYQTQKVMCANDTVGMR